MGNTSTFTAFVLLGLTSVGTQAFINRIRIGTHSPIGASSASALYSDLLRDDDPKKEDGDGLSKNMSYISSSEARNLSELVNWKPKRGTFAGVRRRPHAGALYSEPMGAVMPDGGKLAERIFE